MKDAIERVIPFKLGLTARESGGRSISHHRLLIVHERDFWDVLG